MFRILLEEEPGLWKIVHTNIPFGADAITTARLLSHKFGQAYRLEEYGTELPESQEKKHYAMVLDPGVLNLKVSGLGS